VSRDTTDLLISGVGGQGVLLISAITASACLRSGYDVKQSEVHGMAQRGGSVVSHIRFGSKVYSPLVEAGRADVILALERLEALRWIHYLAPDGTVLVNDQRIDPVTVSSGSMSYPDDIFDRLKGFTDRIFTIDGLAVAKALGNVRVTNVVLLGALSLLLPRIEGPLWEEAIREHIKPGLVDLNLEAFRSGRELMRGSLRPKPARSENPRV